MTHSVDRLVRRKTLTDKAVKASFLFLTLVCSSFVVLIAAFIAVKGISPFFKSYRVDGITRRIDPIWFLFGNEWFKAPNRYGVGYVLFDTVYTTSLALLIAVPVSILTALFIARIAPKWLSAIFLSVIELLASIPSVIFGVFGLLVVTRMVKSISGVFSYQSAGGMSTLSGALVLAMMVIPTITTISATAIKAVPNSQINGSLALGASATQTNFKLVLSSAKSGIISAIALGAGRALGEATAVSMVIGNAGSGPNLNPFDTARTLTSAMMGGLSETSGMDYDIRFSIGLLLLVLIILMNVVLGLVKKRLGEGHE